MTRPGLPEASARVVLCFWPLYWEHPFFAGLFDQGYESFANSQLQERQEMMFPPFAHLAIIKAQHRNEQQLDQLLSAMVRFSEAHDQVSVMGPLPATLARKQQQHRMQIIFSASERKHLHQLISQLKSAFGRKKTPIIWYLDIDPVNFD